MSRTEIRGLGALLVSMSGADVSTLGTMPAQEQAYYKRLGATVFISSGMAAVGMGFTIWTVVVGSASEPKLEQLAAALLVSLAGAVMYGLAIFAIDRMLISQPLRPVVADLPTGNGEAKFKHAPAVSILPRLFPRALLALTIGVLVAEPLLLFAFRQEVNQRALRIEAVARQTAVEDARRTMEDRLTGLKKMPEQVELERLDDTIKDLSNERDAFDRTATQKDQFAAAEAGISGATTIGGQPISGIPKCGTKCRAFQAEAVIARKERDLKQEQINNLQTRRQQLVTAIGDNETQRQATYRAEQEKGEAEMRRAQDASNVTTGLLVRVQALEELAQSEYPFGGKPKSASTTTPIANSTEPASAAPSAQISPSSPPASAPPRGGDEPDADLAKAERGMLGMTSMALAIWLVRLFLIALDTMPVLAKTLMSLRDIRPYEQEVALQEAQTLAAQRLRLRAIGAETQLVGSSIAEARRAAFNEAGGLWIDVDDRKIFVGPNGALNVEDPDLQGLDTTKRPDGTWELRGR